MTPQKSVNQALRFDLGCSPSESSSQDRIAFGMPEGHKRVQGNPTRALFPTVQYAPAPKSAPGSNEVLVFEQCIPVYMQPRAHANSSAEQTPVPVAWDVAHINPLQSSMATSGTARSQLSQPSGFVDAFSNHTQVSLVIRIFLSSQNQAAAVESTPQAMNGLQASQNYSFGDHRAQRKLVLQLTSPTNLLYLTSCTITESMYAQLRSTQELLLDFANFPSYLVRLLQRCATDAAPRNETSQTTSGSRFFIILSQSQSDSHDSPESTGNTCELSIVEANRFKHIRHLNLTLSTPTVPALQRHLALTLATTLELLTETQSKLSKTEASLSNHQATVEQLRSQVYDLEQKLTAERLNAQTRHDALLHRSRAELEEATSALKAEAQIKEKSLQDKLARVEEESSHKLRLLQQQNDELQQLYKSTKQDREDWESKYKQGQTTIEKLQAQITELQQRVLERDTKIAQQDQLLDQQRSDIARLEQRASLAESLVDDRTKQVESLRANASQLETSLQLYAQANEKYEVQLRTSYAEIEKANGIIASLQATSRSRKARIAELTSQLAQVQSQVEEANARCKDLEHDAESARTRTQLLESEQAELRAQLDTSKEELKKVMEEMNELKDTVAYLNQEANRHRVNQLLQRVTASAALSSPTTSSLSSVVGGAAVVQEHLSASKPTPAPFTLRTPISSNAVTPAPAIIPTTAAVNDLSPRATVPVPTPRPVVTTHSKILNLGASPFVPATPAPNTSLSSATTAAATTNAARTQVQITPLPTLPAPKTSMSSSRPKYQAPMSVARTTKGANVLEPLFDAAQDSFTTETTSVADSPVVRSTITTHSSVSSMAASTIAETIGATFSATSAQGEEVTTKSQTMTASVANQTKLDVLNELVEKPAALPTTTSKSTKYPSNWPLAKLSYEDSESSVETATSGMLYHEDVDDPASLSTPNPSRTTLQSRVGSPSAYF